MYGITETCVHVTHQVVGPELIAGGRSLIGAPIPDLALAVLDPFMNLVPPGVAGELWVGGAGPARGYHRRPALTAARFLPDPFSPTAGSRLYRSGDLARWLNDGSLEYLGRMDHQVKIRGFRIELGEIEEALKKHGEIDEAVVLAEETESGGRLLAFVGRVPVQTVRLVTRVDQNGFRVDNLFETYVAPLRNAPMPAQAVL
jgi:acyl-coenzyme A synthetase/AMP-(fatty) acid ligase